MSCMFRFTMPQNNKEKQELQHLIDEISDIAKSVIDDYANTPSEISGSEVRIYEDSPYLDEQLTGKQWKRVVYSTNKKNN